MFKFIDIENNELTSQIKSLILGDINDNNTELLQLIRNPIYEFNINQSSRMVNYYENKGFINSTRENERGKRRFSIIDTMLFNFSIWCKTNGYTDDFIRELNIRLNESEPSVKISSFEMMLMITSITLNIKDYWLKINTSNKEMLTDSVEIGFESLDNHRGFHFSEQLRSQFFNGMNSEGSLKLNGKSTKFLQPFIYNIDKYRNRLGLPLISEENFRLINEFGISAKLIDLGDAKKLNRLPIDYLSKKYDILLEQEDNSLFGIEIKYLGENNYIPTNIRRELVVKNIEELKNMLEQEIKMVVKMRKKFIK